MTTTSPTLLLDHYLKQLKLPTMLREYASIAAACAREDQDHLAFLLRLVERELIEREQRAAVRLENSTYLGQRTGHVVQILKDLARHHGLEGVLVEGQPRGLADLKCDVAQF